MIEYTVKVYRYYTEWYLNNELHCEHGPAVEYADGDKEWYRNDELHRDDGPAILWSNGTQFWYRNGKLHREDGPAIEYANGDKEWWVNDKRHRDDGPAVVWADGYKAWYRDGKELTEAEFNGQTTSRTLTFQFDNEVAAEHFKAWLCESGEQAYREWMECQESEEEGPITGAEFDYWSGDKISVTCGRLDDDS